MSESKKISVFGIEISKKLTLTIAVIILLAYSLYGGLDAQTDLNELPGKVDSFTSNLESLLKALTTLGSVVVAASYNFGQSKVDAAKEKAKGEVAATKTVVKSELIGEINRLEAEVKTLKG